MNQTLPLPGKPAPDLEFPVIGAPEPRWNLEKATPETLSLLVFYRGLHCPVCKTYLQTFEKHFDDFAKHGVELCALSMDNETRATKARADWDISKLPMGYDLDEATARRWGLYISESIKSEEPRTFSEPGLFLVKRDGTLLYAAINSMPFGRPQPGDILDAVSFILEKDYPARGTKAA